MTLIGKIFTVLIFVMSVLFMAFSIMVFATHRNWKEFADNPTPKAGKPLGLVQQLARLQAAKKDADDALQRLKTELAQEQAARKAALAALQVRSARAEQDLAGKQKELTDLAAAHSESTETAKTAQNRLTTLEEVLTTCIAEE